MWLLSYKLNPQENDQKLNNGDLIRRIPPLETLEPLELLRPCWCNYVWLHSRGRSGSRLEGYLEEGPSQYVSTRKVISLFILCSVEHQHAEPAETGVCSLRLELCLLFTGGSSLAINYRHLSLEAWGDPNTLASIEVRQTHRLASVSHGPQLYQTWIKRQCLIQNYSKQF